MECNDSICQTEGGGYRYLDKKKKKKDCKEGGRGGKYGELRERERREIKIMFVDGKGSVA